MSFVCNQKAVAMSENIAGDLLKKIGCASLLLLLAGCSQQTATGFDIGPTSYQQRHPIVIDTSPSTLDIPAGNQANHLTLGMKSAIKGFATDYRRSGARGLDILVPSGSSNEFAASDIAKQSREVLEANGVPGHHIAIRPYSAASGDVPGHVRLAFAATKARVASECGVWPTNIANEYQNRSYENFGCATQSNLAAIVADPNDLIAPRSLGPIAAERSAEVLGGFQANEAPTVLPVRAADAF